MASITKKPQVIIIGGGLGGLALAQSLRKKGIPYLLFERDSNDGARSQGWAISLHDWFISDLQKATVDDMPPLQPVGVTYEEGIDSEGAIFNAHDMTEHVRFGGSTGKFSLIRADRAKMRYWLLTNLDVHWNAKFTHYEQDEDGVTAYFDDGTSTRGDILVGCDGVNSRVRTQLLAGTGIEPQYVPMGMIVGEVTANEEQYTRWLKISTSFFIGYAGLRRIFVGLKGISPDKKTARYYWILGWVDEDAENEYFWTSTASQQELHDFVMNNQLDGVHPSFAEIIRATPVEGMLHPPIRLKDMTPPKLPQGRVTLLGDSVHPMAPFRGEGGNMAMKDGFCLANILDSMNESVVEDALKEYENEMTARTTESVLTSRSAGDPEKH